MRFLLTLLGVALLLPSLAMADRVGVSMSASSTRVEVGEPFAIEVRVDVTGQELDDLALPDFGELEVLGRHTSRPFSFSFGFGGGGQRARVQSQIVHNFTLRATRPGSFTIQPAVATVNGRKHASRPLKIVASGQALQAPPAAAQGQAGHAATPPDGPLDGAKVDDRLFLRTVVDKKEAYVGEQVTFTVYLYVRGQLQQGPMFKQEPSTDGFWVHDLLPPQRRLSAARQDVNGRTYHVYVLRRLAAFPLREGTLKIGAPTVEVGGGASIFSLFGGGGAASLTRRGVDVPVKVRPLPPAPSPDVPTHVGELSLSSVLKPEGAKVGDAVTLEVTAKGTGQLKNLKLSLPEREGLDVLPPEVDDRVRVDVDQMGGERVFRWLLLPRQAGDYPIDAFTAHAFDPVAGKYRTVRSTAHTLTVTGQTQAKAATSPAAPSGDPGEEPSAEASFGPVRTESDLLRANKPIAKRSWFLWAVGMAPLLVAGTYGVRAVGRRRARAAAARRGGRTGPRASDLLDRAHAAAKRSDFSAAYREVAEAVNQAAEGHLDEPARGLTFPVLRQRLKDRGLAEPVTHALVRVLETCEAARFSQMGADQGLLAETLRQAQQVVQALERTPTQKGST